MSNLRGRSAGFRLSVRSALAAFLLIGCIQAVMMGIHYPLAAGVGWFGNWLARKFHTDVLVYHPTPQWDNSAINLVVAVLFFSVFIWITRRTRRRANAEAK
ncbi:MAG TPA: hypothetical protein VJA94_18135 [Candidatus Angelobacter sp.]